MPTFRCGLNRFNDVLSYIDDDEVCYCHTIKLHAARAGWQTFGLNTALTLEFLRHIQ